MMNSSAIPPYIQSLMGNKSFDRENCAANLTYGLQHGTIPLDSKIFITNDAINNFTNPVVTLYWCNTICGSRTGWYPDIGPRLIEWFLPVFLLVSNMQFAPIGLSRFLIILHLFGDPIDSNWSLLDKVESWRRHEMNPRGLVPQPPKMIIRSIAVISCAVEELPHKADLEKATPEADLMLHLTNLYKDAGERLRLLLKTAGDLMENRRNDILRTVLAVLTYIFQTLSVFVKAIGLPSSASGGKIAPAMLLSWLVSLSLLSNAVGDLGSPRTNRKLVEDLIAQTGPPPGQNSSTELRTPHEEYAAWSGAIFCYNPKKRLEGRGKMLASISVLPVAIAFGTAFAVLETGPTYFSCRSLFVIFSFVLWIISAMLTYWLSRVGFATEKARWYTILVKDTLIGGAILVVIVTTSCGLGNTCRCWAGALVYRADAPVPLNPTHTFNRNDGVKYPTMVATGLSLQVCVFLGMLWVGWPGYGALWWSEREKREASEQHQSRTTAVNDVQGDPQESSGQSSASMVEKGPAVLESGEDVCEIECRNLDGREQGTSITIHELRACQASDG